MNCVVISYRNVDYANIYCTKKSQQLTNVEYFYVIFFSVSYLTCTFFTRVQYLTYHTKYNYMQNKIKPTKCIYFLSWYTRIFNILRHPNSDQFIQPLDVIKVETISVVLNGVPNRWKGPGDDVENAVETVGQEWGVVVGWPRI